MSGDTGEVVRASTLPSELRLQLVLGNAIEVVFLAKASVKLSKRDREILRNAASAVRTPTGEAGKPYTLSALDILGAAEQSFGHEGPLSLQDQLDELAEALNALADGKSVDLDFDTILDRLRRLHGALAARSSINPDEVRGFVSA